MGELTNVTMVGCIPNDGEATLLIFHCLMSQGDSMDLSCLSSFVVKETFHLKGQQLFSGSSFQSLVRIYVVFQHIYGVYVVTDMNLLKA